MINELIHDRGRGPEIVGTRITIYNLLSDFLDPTTTEAEICSMYELTPKQVAAARAYIFNNADMVLARHLEIEARMEAGNPPEVIERAIQTKASFMNFKDWLAKRQQWDTTTPSTQIPTFREWLSQRTALVEES